MPRPEAWKEMAVGTRLGSLQPASPDSGFVIAMPSLPRAATIPPKSWGDGLGFVSIRPAQPARTVAASMDAAASRTNAVPPAIAGLAPGRWRRTHRARRDPRATHARQPRPGWRRAGSA